MRATERTQNPRSCGGAPHQRLRVIHVINPIGLITSLGCARRGDEGAPYPLSAHAQNRVGGRCSHAPTFAAAVGAKAAASRGSLGTT